MWGSNENYILGIDDNQTNPVTPFALPEVKTTTPIAASAICSTHSAFLLSDGTVGFMGLNDYGQYGNGESTSLPSARFKEDFGASLLKYAQGTKDWEDVVRDLRESWKQETAAIR